MDDRIEIVIYQDEWQGLSREDQDKIISIMAVQFGADSLEYMRDENDAEE